MKKIFQSKRVRKFSKVIGCLLLIYILGYTTLSTFGSYQPQAVDVHGVMGCLWAPVGFYDAKHTWPGSSYAHKHPSEKTGGWSSFMVWTFLPLFYLDNQLIHKNHPPNPSLEPTVIMFSKIPSTKSSTISSITEYAGVYVAG